MVHLTFISAVLLVFHLTVVKCQGISLKISDYGPCPHCGPLGLGQPPQPPLPPPPHYPPSPVRFYTQNWSGVARNADGSPQGVFTGAAAKAVGDNQATGAAFSLDSSSSGNTNGNVHDAASYQDLNNFYSNGQVNKDLSYQHQSGGNSNFGAKIYNQANQKNSQNNLPHQTQQFNQDFLENGQQQKQLNDFGALVNGGSASSFAKEKQHQVLNEGNGKRKQQLRTLDSGPLSGQSYHESYYSSQSSHFENAQNNGGTFPSLGKEQKYHIQKQNLISNEQQQKQTNDFGTTSFQKSYELSHLNEGQNKVGNGFEYGSSIDNQHEQTSQKKVGQENLSNDGQQGSFEYGQQQQLNGFGAKHSQSSYDADQAVYGKNNGYFLASATGVANQFQGHSQGNGQLQTFDLALQNSNSNRVRDGSLVYGIGGSGADFGLGSTLRGALDLASQGLAASQQTKAACSTCGKGSLAISNAKSNSGAAISLSIGG